MSVHDLTASWIIITSAFLNNYHMRTQHLHKHTDTLVLGPEKDNEICYTDHILRRLYLARLPSHAKDRLHATYFVVDKIYASGSHGVVHASCYLYLRSCNSNHLSVASPRRCASSVVQNHSELSTGSKSDGDNRRSFLLHASQIRAFLLFSLAS